MGSLCWLRPWLGQGNVPLLGMRSCCERCMIILTTYLVCIHHDYTCVHIHGSLLLVARLYLNVTVPWTLKQSAWHCIIDLPVAGTTLKRKCKRKHHPSAAQHIHIQKTQGESAVFFFVVVMFISACSAGHFWENPAMQLSTFWSSRKRSWFSTTRGIQCCLDSEAYLLSPSSTQVYVDSVTLICTSQT